ncbi:MAG: sortase [Bacilli bacterium]|nr:sortase [Bacilli bacterium]
MQKKLNNVEKKRISPYVTAFIGATITLIGGFFLSYNYVQAKKVIAYDYMANAFYNGKEVVTEEPINITEEEDVKKPVEESKLPDVVTNDYIGYLIIPKINLTKGFLDVRSTENDVEKNILVVDGSNYPDTDRGNLILAGHSGTGWKAFFNELYRLQVSDTAYITYKGKKYVYKITNIYKQPKTGKLAIYRDYDKTTLTLITCTNNDSGTQTIYVAELVSVE